MSLQQTIKDNIKKALLSKNTQELSVLRMLISAILNKEKEKRAKLIKQDPGMTEEKVVQESTLTEEEVIAVISSEIKKRKDSIEQYEKGARPDLVKQEKEELAILMEYAPKQLSESEIVKAVKAAIEKTGANSVNDIGKVMGVVMADLKGKADGNQVRQIVQNELNQ